ncbi:MAG TPA: protein kinase [Myxococcales bacterium]
MLAVDLEYATAEEIAGVPGVAEARTANELAGCLVQAGVLTDDERRLLEQAVARTENNSVSTMAEPAASSRKSNRQKAALQRETMIEAAEKALGGEDDDAGVAGEHPGRYEMRGVHGRGGQARILLAWDAEMEREVAFKVMRDASDGSQSLPPSGASKRSTPGKVRFLREARVTAALEHPNIVPVHEVGRRDTGQLYYTMRFVRGKTLSAALAECLTLPDRLKRLGAFWDLCKAMSFAHSRGVVHRDLKPENVMVGEFGETVLLDWGVAKVRGERDIRAHDLQKELEAMKRASSSETAAGTAVGTPSYMSPEQAKGLVDEIDDRSDVWGLGAVLYEILTGHPPFAGKTPVETLHEVVKEPLMPVREWCSDAPPELAAVAEKCLQKNKAERYASAKEVADEIAAYMTGSKLRAYHYSSWELLKRFAAQNKVALAAAAIVLLVIVGSLISVTFSLGRERVARAREEQARGEEAAARAQEHRERLVANYHLAQAFTEKADRLAEEQRFLSATVLASAALQHNPTHPKSPFFAEGFEKDFPSSRLARVVAASQIYRARFASFAALEQTLKGSESFELVAYSPDGKQVAAADGKVVHLWDRETGKPLRDLEGHTDRVFGVAFSPDGTTLATSGRDRSIILWDVATFTRRMTVQGHKDTVSSVLFSPDGALLASGSWDHLARLWDARTGEPKFALAAHKERVNQLAFSPDGKVLATSSHDGTVRLWNTATGKPEKIVLEPGSSVLSVAFSPDGTTIATGAADKKVMLFDARTGASKATLEGHKDGATALAYSPDGALLISTGYDKSARIWDGKTGRALLSIDAHDDYIEGLAIAPDGKQFATSSYDRTVKLWDLKMTSTVPTLSGHGEAVYCLAYSPDSSILASSGWDRTVRLWDVASRKPIATLQGHADAVDGGLVFLDEHRLASAGKDHSIRVWEVPSGKLLKVLQGHKLAVYGLSVSPDRAVLVSAGYDKTLRFWDTKTLEPMKVVEGQSEPLDRTVFSPDGALLATAGYDKAVKLWDPKTYAVLKTMTGHEDWVSGVHFSADGKTLASSGKDGKAILWDVGTGKEIRRLLGHSQWVNDVRFSHDGKLLATASDDTTVRVWSAQTGEPQLILQLSREGVAIEFSPDDQTLAVGDGFDVKLYPLDFSALDADPKVLLGESEKNAGQKLDGSQLKSANAE